MKVIALPESTERLLEMIKEEVCIADDEEIIFTALLYYEKNIRRAKQELKMPSDKSSDKLFWKFWSNIYERCAALKKLEDKR